MADLAALPMFCLSLTYLIVVAIAIVLLVDVQYFHMTPTAEETHAASEVAAYEVTPWVSQETAQRAGNYCLAILVLIWPVFFLELAVQFVVRDTREPFFQSRYMSLLVCLCPPLRMCARNRDMDGKIWFPTLGWQTVNDDLREQLARLFSIPMIFIALTILPILLIEYGMRHQVNSRPWLQFLLHFGTGVIWFAFAAEFIVMVSVADKKLRYCKQHWLDLAIILIPFIAFLRSLRAVRAMRMARLAKIQQLSRMGRLYRLRGLALRAVRALMILQLLNRVFRIGPERQLKKLNLLLEEKEKEIALLRREIAKLEELVEQQKQAELAAADPQGAGSLDNAAGRLAESSRGTPGT